ncbi:hypothetical protein BLA29_005459 [Euroglyphus maynei]|uniref:Uncharacterized protein n=1 Tax=Euroglyphus maynei TaxID=6958 RepID=A0A1Y3BCI2_EURMA|nr:hypothetical protein BLA29_005459 [Euroglyphus maynei]
MLRKLNKVLILQIHSKQSKSKQEYNLSKSSLSDFDRFLRPENVKSKSSGIRRSLDGRIILGFDVKCLLKRDCITLLESKIFTWESFVIELV